jgi:hypothetical protein
MLKQKNYPRVYWFDGVTTTGISFFMLSYGRDPITLPLETTHYLYFGKNKPINALYVEMGSVVNSVNGALTVEYHDGSGWVSVDSLVDDTNFFKRSGYIQFDRPTDWAEQTIGSEAQYFLRISVSANVTPTMSIQGMNIVFSDDQDLNGIYPGITQYLQPSEDSFILRHENSRDLIVQDIRNQGLRKKRELASYYENIDAWDFLEVEEVKNWSAYLTLANIFSSLQSNTTDLYKEKADDYEEKAEFYKAQFYLSIDKDGDGLKDNEESANQITTKRLKRV